MATQFNERKGQLGLNQCFLYHVHVPFHIPPFCHYEANSCLIRVNVHDIGYLSLEHHMFMSLPYINSFWSEGGDTNATYRRKALQTQATCEEYGQAETYYHQYLPSPCGDH